MLAVFDAQIRWKSEVQLVYEKQVRPKDDKATRRHIKQRLMSYVFDMPILGQRYPKSNLQPDIRAIFDAEQEALKQWNELEPLAIEPGSEDEKILQALSL